MVHSGREVRLRITDGSYFYLLASDARAVLRPAALCLMKMRCPVSGPSGLWNDRALILEVIGIVLVAFFLNKALRQGLRLVLHVLLELVGRFTER